MKKPIKITKFTEFIDLIAPIPTFSEQVNEIFARKKKEKKTTLTSEEIK